jgi:hypothetical protein
VFLENAEAKLLQEQGHAVFLSHTKNISIPKGSGNVDDFEKHVSRTVFEFYDRCEYPTMKDIITLSLRDRISYQCLFSYTL